MNDRLEYALTRFKTKLKGKSVEEADAVVLDEICRMNSQQLAAAYIFLEGLTTSGRRSIIANRFDIR